MPIEYNVKIPMRDGLALSAALCRPDGEGPFAVVLTRSCYTKWSVSLARRASLWNAAGYALVVQDVRGRGDSEGSFYPLVDERQDGCDTLDWLHKQPWCNGRVVMIGASYGGWTQMYVAADNHPALAAICPVATPPDPDKSFPFDRGMIAPSAAAWLATLDGHTNQDTSECDVAGAFATLPIIDFDRHIGRHLPAWRDWATHPPGSPYWRAQRYQERLLGSRVPMLHISGWYDDCLTGALENFAAMSSHAQDPAARAAQRLIIGPWMHGSIGQRISGETDYGAAAELDLPRLQAAWFGAHLRGEADMSPPVRLFIMGRNEWLEALEWPVQDTAYIPFYFHSAGNANSRLGDGELSLAPPDAEPADSFRYDPADPVPYSASFDWRQVGGPDDFADIELRPDILCYTGPCLTEPLLLCGPLVVHLYAGSSAPDTDWTAKILDVWPDGRAIRLNDGAMRARFRNGETAHFLTPGTIEAYSIACAATCIEIPVGHRLRVEISSSAFGKIDLNLNTGGPVGRETDPIIAVQFVYHDRAHPSHLLLPVLRR